MPHVTIGIDVDEGPLIRLRIGVGALHADALHRAGLPLPTPVLLDFLIDTGASCTVIDKTALAPLQLTPTGKTEVETATTGGEPLRKR